MTATRLLTLALLAVVGVTLLAAPVAAQSMTDDGTNETTMTNGSMVTTTDSSMDDGSMMTTESMGDESMDDGSMMTTESMDDGSMAQNMTESMNDGSMAQNMTETGMSEETTETAMSEETTDAGGAATDAGEDTTSGTGPGFTVVLALVALAGIGLLAARRRA